MKTKALLGFCVFIDQFIEMGTYKGLDKTFMKSEEPDRFVYSLSLEGSLSTSSLEVVYLNSTSFINSFLP